ncbi:aspartate aminotransferase family protein [Aquisalimonas lutea]|uniref:aspartate aminotransferase family protein n=1 Tax=Aquisalimonas lutea TaxID=1327750 RepID=UPI0025B4A944|nr:aspartate aminotransferase family protein [Aquisalimonas lutea]MDN3518887.1 aspartate aminotransferase family protein [Aquisalimonas lutea]
MAKHADLLARHKAVLPDWLALYYDEPIALEHGSGRHVTDAEGNAYLDLFGGILTTMTAHALPQVVEAVRAQAGRLLHSSTLYLIEPQIELAEEIARLAPMDEAKVFFTTSGSEANELALLLACTERRSHQVLALRNSYHGRSFATMGITGNRGWSASALSPVDVKYVHGGYRYRSPFRNLDDRAYIDACVEDLEDVIATQTAGDVACFIAEPIQGVGGFATPPDGLFGAMKEVLDRHGILYITDEVQTGWGRTGEHFWGIQAHAVTPDILTFAKGIGNGLTIAGVVARPALMDAVTANSISTFGGNPLSCAGALANLRYALEHDLQGNARRVGGHMLTTLRERTADLPSVAEIRGKGLMIGIELVRPGTREPDPAAAARAIEAARERGVLIGKGGLYNNVLRIGPPLTLTRDEADQGIAAIEAALRDGA